MKLCECGCGKEVTRKENRFLVGHYIRIAISPLRGKKLSEETKKKIGEANKGRKLSEEMRKKLSESHKDKKFSDETKMKMSEAFKNRAIHPMKGKKHTEETRIKMSEAHKGEKCCSWKGGVKKNHIALYETYAHQLKPIEEVRRRRFKELGEADMQVRCYHCKKWFYPTRDQVSGRIGSLNIGGDGSHFYCKEECKQSCSIYLQKKYPKGYLPESNRPDIDPYWRSEVIKRAEGRCERCDVKTDKLHAHHEKPATLFPMLANDIGNGWAVCEQCHYILIHGQDGCRFYELRVSIC